MSIKIIASDMDGTLLNDQATISQNNLDAIQKATNAGIQFVIATGRGLSEVKPLIKNLTTKPAIITLNGALVYDSNTVPIVKIPLEKATLFQSIAAIKKKQLYFEIVTDHGIYSTSRFQRLKHFTNSLRAVNLNLSFDQAFKKAQQRPEIVNINYVADYESILQNPTISVMKLLVFADEKNDALSDLRHQLEQLPEIIITSSAANNLEINNKKAQKGTALQEFAQKNAVDMQQVMAIGDNLNDESMIKVAGLGVAMDNAVPAIKELAQYQTTSNKEDGVAKAIDYALNLSV
ncbi:Cof-type HAD-IIB family hydrolase [Bombilactobacillus thymidiniphilus]|uniref:Cof-type HAD-IIB family hydrolase n=1 Tax=Bombilactobacillus thymidiniphilus TaxID=2923363 RepID=A0ABY4PDG7_9LACO|nr:Cof-type HAD-IIB family hydrolase [Bombilactobacillus thymidiniphilus]UQS83818.1 Cof-type HAD-IIB family hydrolase [Bombilactobacillus thymidiniphilus]